ncbi:FecR family protein [Ereboglobus luteus]|uniref:FecR protein domain-containing protein n=1 Tax=Ereboglobus luteus TaxID=1796921 RepID=A0A2U8DZY6_9BACT|nr:FecR domain-containing protein [Ereboglobus luteus]AWI08163.1 hypothetical protein CKA38_01795 [Ereboglobus luteus]
MDNDSDKKNISEAAARWFARRDAGLSKAETAEFEQWLAADTRHGAAFDRYTRAWAALTRPVRTGEQGALAHELQAQAGRRRRGRRARVAITAASVAVVIAFAVLWQRPSADVAPVLADAPQTQQREKGVVTVTSPERRALEDGSTVELRPGAVIDVRYDDEVRRVVLVRGEAHFQVAKGLPRPFVVEVDGMEVRAVGTAFAVERGTARVEVWVTEGRVAVEKPATLPDGEGGQAFEAERDPDWDEPTAPAPVAAKPVLMAILGVCERAVLETAPWAPPPVVTTVTSDEINKRMAWRISRLEFSATPLAEAVELINRHSQLPDGSKNARLVLDESMSGLMTEPVSGYSHANDIETFVRLLGASMGIEIERRGDEIILRKREK